MIKRREFLFRAVAVLLSSTALPTVLLAGQSKVYSNSSTGIAINGYDPVAYFTQGKPVEGRAEYLLAWSGATWYFSSAVNKALFEGNPDKYAPQYGGYCAFAVSYGSTATTVPEAWSIVDGKLYLNNSIGVRSRWDTNQKGYISKANKNWPKVLN